MSKLAYLQGKGQKFKIGDQELELKPLSVNDIELFSIDKDSSMEKQTEMTKKLISRVLKASVPDSTDDEINNISLEHLNDLMSAITKLHKLSEGDTRMQTIKNAIKARQAKAKGSR